MLHIPHVTDNCELSSLLPSFLKVPTINPPPLEPAVAVEGKGESTTEAASEGVNSPVPPPAGEEDAAAAVEQAEAPDGEEAEPDEEYEDDDEEAEHGGDAGEEDAGNAE